MDDLLARAIAKQNGLPYGASVGGAAPAPPTYGAGLADPSMQLNPESMLPPPAAPQNASEATFQQHERFLAGAPAQAHPMAADGGMGAMTTPDAPPAVVRTIMPSSLPEQTSDPMASIDALAGTQADAALRMGAAEEASAKRQQAIAEAYAKDADEIAAKHNDKYAAADAAYQKTMAEYRAMNEKIAKMPPITAKTPGVWGALALVGAGFSEGLSGGTNDAVNQQRQAIDAKIQRDIDLQQQNLDNKRTAANAKFTEVGVARQYLGDTREATQFALALRKDRFAAAMESEALKLKSATARDKALQTAGQFRIEAKKEQLDVLKSLLAGRMSAVDVAMLAKMGVLPAGVTSMGGGSPNAGAPAGSVTGKLTKAQQGEVNLAAHRAVVGDWAPKDPSKADPVQTRKVQDYFSQNRVYANALDELEGLYRTAMDPNVPESERALATTQFGIKRDEAIAKLSVKDEQGVVTNPEFARKIESLKSPPQNVVSKGQRSVEEWWNGTTSGPQVFRAMRNSAERELSVFMDSHDWVQGGVSSGPQQNPAKPKPAASAKPKAKPAVATSPEDFD